MQGQTNTDHGRGVFGIDALLAAEKQAICARRRVKEWPHDPIGLALSGGGIRSAAVCLGAIQAFDTARDFPSIDYLSSVSGGGYTATCLNAAMTSVGGETFPFSGDGFKDSAVLRHIRNYSNYLMPRGRSSLRNCGEGAAILLRGVVVNAICVLAFLLPCVMLTAAIFPSQSDLARSGGWVSVPYAGAFSAPSLLAGIFGLCVVTWATVRSNPRWDRSTSDTKGVWLLVAWLSLVATIGSLWVVFQPAAILAYLHIHNQPPKHMSLKEAVAAVSLFGGIIAGLSNKLAKFLMTTSRSRTTPTLLLRGLAHVSVALSGMILPALIWFAYLGLCAWAIAHGPFPFLGRLHLGHSAMWLLATATLASWAVMLLLRSNGYSLHSFYRDRLSKAFLVSTASSGCASMHAITSAESIRDLLPLDELKLSALEGSKGPYPLINASINLQGSAEANKRGRNADFFVFTPNFVGCDLTGYVETKAMERADKRLDLASAMAISGAAASANMGSSTVRVLSPTLALLNIRLGYYLKNPKYFGQGNSVTEYLRKLSDRFYLFVEMFNGLSENRSTVYLTDGGHIDNLGIYVLLKRKCRLIIVIDAEADPDIGCPSLMRVERYARIDLGIRLILPWEPIRKQSRKTSAELAAQDVKREAGPHIAIGHILYPDGSQGYILYVKASLSGDEKDYILDYAERNARFPHETTGDQFFTEEQFEMYRALGYHMTYGLYGGDRLAFIPHRDIGGGQVLGFHTEGDARSTITSLLMEARPK